MELLTTPASVYTPPETAIVHSAEASLTAGPRPCVVHLVQYDRTMPILAVRLTENNAPYAVPAGAAVNFRAAKPDGTFVYNPALGVSADRGTAYIAVTQQTAAAAGTLRAVIEIVRDGAVAATAHISAEIEPNPVPQDAIESSDEYKTIYDLLLETQAAAEAAKASETAAKASETAAKNSQTAAKASENAAKTSETNAAASKTAAASSAGAAATSANAAKASENAAKVSQTAAKNSEDAAKKYAEQAQQVSQGAVGYYETGAALRAAHPTAEAGNWAIVGDTDTIWVWDTDGPGWLDSGQNVDLSNYYTKSQTDAAISSGTATTISQTLPISKGGTGATTASAARANLAVLCAKNANGYDGMATTSGGDTGSNDWIRTTKNGLLPYSTTNKSSLGTASWHFGSAYIDTVHGNLDGTATYATSAGSAVDQTARNAAASAQSTANSANTAAANANSNANNRMPIAGGTFTGDVAAPTDYGTHWHLKNNTVRNAAWGDSGMSVATINFLLK